MQYLKYIASRHLLFSLVALAIFLVLVLFIYLPGLRGDFLLDDFGNLPPLFDAIKADGFWYGVFSGGSGPLGRPLTLLTFAWQQNIWPHPYNFKFFNLSLHLINACLVFCLVRLLTPFLLSSLSSRHYSLFALCMAVIWALLPIHVSTVLYVVQRMVLLSTFFSLLGVICFIGARYFLTNEKILLAVVCFSGSLLMAALSIFSKESGLLMFAYLICVEMIIKNKKPISNSYYKWVIYIALGAPLILFCAYLFHIRFYEGYAVRPFSMVERVLTETRVLWVYVHQILLPKPSDLGLYHDSFPISHSLFDPLTTLISCIAWFLVVIALIWSVIKKQVQVFFPCLWFLAGHLMESTIISLEIYFEHRNYLASLGLVLMMGLVFVFLIKKISSTYLKYLFVGLTAIYLASLIAILNMQTTLWGNPLLFNYVHAKERPGSIRARSLLVDYYQSIGNSKAAYEALESIEKDFPQEPAIYFLKMQFACTYPYMISPPDVNLYKHVLQKGEFSNGTLKAVEDMVSLKNEHGCDSVDYTLTFKALKLLGKNENYSHKYYFIARFESMLYLQLHDMDGAVSALESIPYQGYDDAIGYARLLAATRSFDKALAAVEVARKNVGTGVIRARHEKELEELISYIKDDMVEVKK